MIGRRSCGSIVAACESRVAWAARVAAAATEGRRSIGAQGPPAVPRGVRCVLRLLEVQ
jgi:hypothetical protein